MQQERGRPSWRPLSFSSLGVSKSLDRRTSILLHCTSALLAQSASRQALEALQCPLMTQSGHRNLLARRHHNTQRSCFTCRNLDLGRIACSRICYSFGTRLSSHRNNRDSRAPQSLCSTYPFPPHTQKHPAKLRAAVLLARWGVHYRPSILRVAL